ncbi:MAG TPA: twin-arginine translocase TatA/TatE family subunit [Solirubrobacteraceae bacterium]
MLGLDNPVHLLFLLAALLLIFGAKRLPEMGRSLGEGLRGFKESITGDPNHAEMSTLPRATEPAQQQPVGDRTEA